MSGHEVAVNAVAVVGDCIVSGSGDTTIRVWRGGAEAAATPQIGAPIRALAQVPQSWGGAAFASAGNDACVRTWALPASGKPVQVAQATAGDGYVFALARTEAHLVSGGDDCVVRVWSPKLVSC